MGGCIAILHTRDAEARRDLRDTGITGGGSLLRSGRGNQFGNGLIVRGRSAVAKRLREVRLRRL